MPNTTTLAVGRRRLRSWPLARLAQVDHTSATRDDHRTRSRVARVFLGSVEEPRWARPLLWLLLLATAALYLVDLSSSGTANSFYAAAVKSGTESWKAWLFGSLDSGNSITVDKPPAALWLMVLSARILGFSSFSMLLPQALMGVATVGVLHATVKRWSGPAAGLIAGALVALTPVAALMFRFNNPDALLVLLMTVAAYYTVRAVDAPAARAERPRALRWILLAGTAIGFAFLTKMAQGLLVLPAFGLVYLVASPLRLRARIGHLLAATGALVVSAGWFIALVEIWPAAARPYIGGSTNNSLWELAIGYNGLGRIFSGAGNGGSGGGSSNTSFGGSTGITRMFGTAFGSEVSWLIPAALIGLLAGLWFSRKAPRTDRTRAGLLLWGTWLVVSGLVFSFMSGTIHPYYVVALPPAIGALTATAATVLWQRRNSHLARGLLALMIAATAGWGFYLMGRDASGWMTWLKWATLVGGVLGAAGLAASTGALKKLAVAAVIVGSLASLGGTAGFTAATASSAHSGSIPVAGPVAASSTDGMGRTGRGTAGGQAPTGTRPSGTAPGSPSSSTSSSTASSSSTKSATAGAQQDGGGDASNTALVALLNKTTTKWSAATIGDQSAARYILSTDTAVMSIGGWSGSDASPTLAQFQQYVKEGKITYLIISSSMSGGGSGSSSSVGTQITTWVKAHYTATTVGGTTIYKLTS